MAERVGDPSDGPVAGDDAEDQRSPFPLDSIFGILPYAVWHGHLEIVRGFLQAGAKVDATALVLAQSYPQRWAIDSLGLNYYTAAFSENEVPRGSTDCVRVTSLQIAIYKRDTAAAKLLLQAGVEPAFHHLLDIIQPLPGSLFASKAGSWSPQAHFCFPPAFKAAAAELLRISHKHGGVWALGRLKWAFDSDMLVGLLLPVMAWDAPGWLNVPSIEEWEGGDGDETSTEDSEEELEEEG